MAVTYNKNYKYYEVFFYVKVNHKLKQIHKRGFKTKKEAKEYEWEYIKKHNNSLKMTFESALDIYMDDCKRHLKLRTVLAKQINLGHALKYFRGMELDSITPLNVRQFHNELLKENYANTTLRSFHVALSTMFNFFVKYYGLKQNPCCTTGSIGSNKPKTEMKTWTVEDFNKFIESLKQQERHKMYVVAFYLLFWSGMRIGELQALTIGDFDFEKNTININKTYAKINRKTVYTARKQRGAKE